MCLESGPCPTWSPVLPRAEGTDPAPIPTAQGRGHGRAGTGENSGVPAPSAGTHCSHTLRTRHRRRSTAPIPRPPSIRTPTSTPRPRRSPELPNTHAASTHHCPPEPLQGRPLPRGPRDPCPQRPPHLPRLGLWEHSSPAPWALPTGSHTTLLPTDILESPLISLEGAAQPPARQPHG